MLLTNLHKSAYITLALLRDSKEKSGRTIREELAKTAGLNKSLAAFYQLMYRLECASLVYGENRATRIEDQECKCRWYTLTESGRLALDEARQNLSHSKNGREYKLVFG